LCNKLDSLASKFWWGSNTDHKRTHWINWKKTCKRKVEGGMGFRDTRAFNEAMLAKQGWRILTEPTSLMARVLKAKYFPKNTFMQAKSGPRASYSWQSILKARWILKKGCFWWVGQGNNINIWNDRWINPHSNSTTWTKKPNNTSLHNVQDLIDPTTQQWNTQTIQSNFIPVEANLIIQIPLPGGLDEDTVTWQGTKDGNYTVRSGYNAQME
jgi:hypothetical protein